ncbi:hypothetical protein ANCCAN_06119 [Ancylostoma caninum]|uniref:Spermine/spermidine synthase n=1 Tax=Ancylostoma caninum TaxID=29170 RepID=A0A368GTT7_ANCCA|nr:hypothetical protein ANCCAN_06119 [Ancylostoma caninum]
MYRSERCCFYVLAYIFSAALIYLRRNYFDFHKSPELDESVNDDSPKLTKVQARAIAEKFGKARVLAKSICLNDGQCVDVRDVLIYDDDGYRFRREIIVERIEISTMYLMMPEKEIFLSGAVNMERETSVRLLTIGLGAGYVNSYLHHHFPEMEITIVEIDPKMVEIARKWFDLTLDDRQRLIISDGFDYIKEAVEKGITASYPTLKTPRFRTILGEKYDIVLLDACNMGENGACPLRSVKNRETAETFSSLLTERGLLKDSNVKMPYLTVSGALIANVFGLGGKTIELGKELISLYGTAFKHCSLRRSPNSNLVLTCSHQSRPEGLEEKYRRFMNYPSSGVNKLPFVELV